MTILGISQESTRNLRIILALQPMIILGIPMIILGIPQEFTRIILGNLLNFLLVIPASYLLGIYQESTRAYQGFTRDNYDYTRNFLGIYQKSRNYTSLIAQDYTRNSQDYTRNSLGIYQDYPRESPEFPTSNSCQLFTRNLLGIYQSILGIYQGQL